ncbi:MAG: bacteriocin [Nostoc sp.]|uniref:bacteriocin n=1 Tax=Nostoc sp. TaxID=1180 RepID=UPI002FF81A28
MIVENVQPNEMLELSNQELDNIAGGATSDVFGKNANAEDYQFGFVEIPKEGGITSVTFQVSVFSEQDLREFKEAGISSPEA